jgi:hypothetical protein
LGWLLQPRNFVFGVLASGVVFGGGYKLWQAWNTRKRLNRLNAEDVAPNEIVAAADLGRVASHELFELLKKSRDPERRRAAAQALSRLWVADELVGEEEQAIVRHGHRVTWHARRVYPRAISRPIPIIARFDFDFFRENGGIASRDIELSTRVMGAHRVSLESFSPWARPAAPLRFDIEPRDFAGRGPHTLRLEAKVRPVGLTSTWEVELPASTFNIEFDEHMRVESILTQPDAGRAALVDGSIRLVAEATAVPAPVGGGFALRYLPTLELAPPLPFDLAAHASIEIDGCNGRVPAGQVVVLAGDSARHTLSLYVSGNPPVPAIDHAGYYRARVVLTPDPEFAWSAPAVRSAWPEPIATAWTEIEVVRL